MQSLAAACVVHGSRDGWMHVTYRYAVVLHAVSSGFGPYWGLSVLCPSQEAWKLRHLYILQGLGLHGSREG